MNVREPDLRRTWLFGPGADVAAHERMLASSADVVIVDFEDSTPQARRDEARGLIGALRGRIRDVGALAAVRINSLETEGPTDLGAAMPAHPEVIAYPMARSAEEMRALHRLLDEWEGRTGTPSGSTEILPVCETALGVADVRAIAAGSPRIRCALLGTEDLAADLCAERRPDADELDYARRRFVLECRAAGIEPIDAPYTFGDTEGAIREARFARRLGYRCKSVVQPEHVQAINAALTPSEEEVRHALSMIEAFEAARARGEDRALVDGLWVEVPTYRGARRLVERARRLGGR